MDEKPYAMAEGRLKKLSIFLLYRQHTLRGPKVKTLKAHVDAS